MLLWKLQCHHTVSIWAGGSNCPTPAATPALSTSSRRWRRSSTLWISRSVLQWNTWFQSVAVGSTDNPRPTAGERDGDGAGGQQGETGVQGQRPAPARPALEQEGRYPVTIYPTIPKYRLFQHNQPFPWGSSGNLTVAGGLLSMTNVSRAYAGEYVCNADNGVGSQPVRRVVRLNVLCEYETQSPDL